MVSRGTTNKIDSAGPITHHDPIFHKGNTKSRRTLACQCCGSTSFSPDGPTYPRMRILKSKSSPSDPKYQKTVSPVLKATSKFPSSRPCAEVVVSSLLSISVMLIVCIREVVAPASSQIQQPQMMEETVPKMFKAVVMVDGDKKLECLELLSQIFAGSTRYCINARYVISELSVSLC